MTDANLTERASDARERLEALRHERGVALLDGKPIANEPIDQTAHELDALTEAEAERVRREREAAAATLKAARERTVARLAGHEVERQAALARAQTSACELVANLQAAMDAGAAVGLCFTQLGKPTPLAVIEPNFASRMGDRLCAVLGTLRGHKFRLGRVQWGSTYRQPTDNWAQQEAAELAGEIQSIKGT